MKVVVVVVVLVVVVVVVELSGKMFSELEGSNLSLILGTILTFV
jgi:hypothetical protein